jgi:hypothetical protein
MAAAALLPVGKAHAAEGDHDFFETRIRPLLVERCLGCHSSATGKTSGGLALDTRVGWQRGGDSGPAIVPGKLEESLLIKAVRYADDGPQMPPEEKGGGKLSAAEIALLEEWVKRGAPDPREAAKHIGGMTLEEAKSWWAFQPFSKIAPPSGENAWGTAPANEIDHFIGHTLQEKGLRPNKLGEKRTLLRRATFDLTGLPPTREEIDAFVADESPDAFAKVVNRLLASPAYGERWGRHWLDVARYADTAGDGADYPVREAYQYRDWVVRAFNRDLPFRDFIRQQIAGDLLAAERPLQEYADCVTATGFLAIGKRYGYNPSPDYQYLDFADVIDSVGRSVLGLSLGCARCHDHKFDPVSTQDYYALYGILQSTKWAFPGGEEHKRPANFPPLVPPAEAARLDAEKQASLAKLDAQITELKAEQAKLDDRYFAGGLDLAFEGQEPGKPPSGVWLSAGPNQVLAEAQSPFATTHSKGTRGVRLGSGQPNEGVRYVWPDKRRIADGKPLHFAIDFRTLASDKRGAYRFYLGRGVIESLAIQLSITADEICVAVGDKWQTLRKLEADKWYTLRLTFDPQQKNLSGVVGTPDDLTTIAATPWNATWDGVLDTFICDAIGHVAGPTPARDLDNLGLQSEPFASPKAEPIAAPQRPADAKERLADLAGQIDRLTKQRQLLAEKPPYATAYGVSEAAPVNAKIQKRGDPYTLGEEVPRRYLEVLGGEHLDPAANSSGRLELANWLVDERRPLAARVFVNRVWQWHFNRGLVETSSDFGSRGARPSHPELLEWLTGQFLASGGSLKALHRLIMSSRTYQLASDDDAGNLQVDPANRWLWRYSRRPLDAESIRDAMLLVSGRLDPSPAGPHPFPPTESWGFTIHNPFHAVYDNNHRSIYLMVQRNRRHPYLAMFDAADPNASVGERLPTTTPTQALYFMNSPFIHEQARGFGERIMHVDASDEARIAQAVAMAHGKSAAESEVVKLKGFLTAYRSKLSGLGRPVAQADREAWTALARVLLTSNEFLFVD